MTPEFILGFIAGEGSFTTTCAVREDAKHGVYPTIRFKLNVKEREVLDEIQEQLELGQVKDHDNVGQSVWRITNNKELKEFSKWIKENADCGFKESKKYDSFIVWSELLDERSEMIKSKDGIKEFIDKSRKINSESARTVSKSTNKLKGIVDSSTNYICGVESTYTNCCENPVDDPDSNCHRHT